MDQRRLTEAINRMLKGGERDRIVEFLHLPYSVTSEQFDDFDRFRKAVTAYRHFIVRETPRWRIITKAITTRFDKLISDFPMHLYSIEQGLGMGIAHRRGMFERDAPSTGHFPPSRGAVMLEHRTQALEQVSKIGLAEPGSIRKLGVDEHMGTVERIRHDMLAAHRAVLRPLVALVTFLPVGLLLLVGGSHASDGDFERQNRFNRARKSNLHRPAHLTGIDTRAHYRAKGADIEEVVAHEFGKRPGLLVALRIEFTVLRDLFGVSANRLVGLAMAIVEDRALLHIDAVARLIALGELCIIANLALQRHIADQTFIGFGVHARQVAGVGIAVRIAIGHVEQEDDVVTIGERGHQEVSPGLDFSDL